MIAGMRTPARHRPQLGSALSAYLQDINSAAHPPRRQERELAEPVANAAPFARGRLIRANRRLVVDIAKGYLGRGLSLEDLIAEGNLGLMRAGEGYDHTRDVRFSTYASFWIKQSMQR